MYQKLYICIFILMFFTSCESQNTPQPKLTVLSDPSSPIASSEPEEIANNSITGENTNNFSPQDTMQAFCIADFNGIRTSAATYQQIIPYILWEEELPKDAAIISDFRIVNSVVKEDEANFAVAYNKIGVIKADEKGIFKIENVPQTTETLTYKLVKDKGQWKIESPQPPPHISLEAAKKLVTKK